MRKRISDRISRAISWRVDERIAAGERIRNLEAQLAEANNRLQRMSDDLGFMRATYDRMEPQLAALEWRMEDLRYRVRHIANDGELDELAAEARAEHERARIRLELASHYEERLRRLEEPGNA